MLVYFMLKGEMPFGSWRESEIDTFAKIAKGKFTLPQNFSPEVVDLITKVSLLITTLLHRQLVYSSLTKTEAWSYLINYLVTRR